jgi:hypothetical protein
MGIAGTSEHMSGVFPYLMDDMQNIFIESDPFVHFQTYK